MPSLVAHGPNNGLYEQAGHRACEVQQGELLWIGVQKGVNGVDGGLLQAKTILNAEKTDVHVDDLPKREGWSLRDVHDVLGTVKF